MAKKRKSKPNGADSSKSLQKDQYTVDETFDDSEDEFYTHRDKILLEEEPAAKRRRKIQEETAELEPSDEEVYEQEGISDSGDDDDDAENEEEMSNDDAGREQEEEEEDERYWGSDRRDYYNADAIETEADALEEEAEARRLQQKQLTGMTEADFGLDEFNWAPTTKTDDVGRRMTEKLPELQIPENATKEERLEILRSRYPEFEPLIDDLLNLMPRLEILKSDSNPDGDQTQPDASSPLVKYRALSVYLASIAMYIMVLTSTKDGIALSPAALRDHPVMTSLLRCRQLWDKVKDLQPMEVQPVSEAEIVQPDSEELQPVQKPARMARVVTSDVDISRKAEPKKPKAVIEDEYQDLSVKPKKQKKAKRTELRDIINEATNNKDEQEVSDLGDEAPLTREEAAQKAQKKKSLRFYTSQISQKAHKRGAKSREAGGDDDIPYKERLKDKQARLAREADQRQSSSLNHPLSDNDNDSHDDNDRDLVNEINTDSNEYYSEILSQTTRKKAEKQARAAQALSTLPNQSQPYEEETLDPNGKRKITYAIAANKGLTPRRKKEVRNPRVKKKMRYEAKMKKLGSVRAVFKGGEGKGGYKGELTGIKSNLVKSVKL
jgi:U3 small nucleolar RNA-associated protein 3